MTFRLLQWGLICLFGLALLGCKPKPSPPPVIKLENFEPFQYNIVTADTFNADQKLRRKCRENDYQACLELASTQPFTEMKTKYYKKACDGGVKKACFYINHGDIYKDPASLIDEVTFSEAETDCENGEADQCAELSLRLLSQKTEENSALAWATQQKACDISLEVCENLARRLIEDPVFINPKNARQIFIYGCEKGSAPLCLSAAHVHKKAIGGPKDTAKAKHYLRKACDASSGTQCWRSVKQLCADPRGTRICAYPDMR